MVKSRNLFLVAGGLFFVFLLLAVMPALVSAASSGAAIQVSAYHFVPEKLRPGTSGQLQITLTNTGNDAAADLYVTYNSFGQLATVSGTNGGDIGQGGSTVLTIPFTIPATESPGVKVIGLQISYSGKTTPASIPAIVENAPSLEVKTLSVSSISVLPGNSFSAEISLENGGGAINEIFLQTPSDSPFTLNGTSRILIGGLAAGESKHAQLQLTASSSAVPGKYSVPIIVNYTDAVGNEISEQVGIGPVVIIEPSAQFRLKVEPETTVEVGNQVVFAVTLANIAGEQATGIILEPQASSTFVPLGEATAYIDVIPAAASRTVKVKVGINSAVISGYYPLSFLIKTNGGANTYNQTIGIFVEATPQVTITSEQASATGTTSILVSNTGNSPIRSVYVKVSSTDLRLSGTTEKFLGTLNVDDFGNIPVTASAMGGTATGEHTILVSVSYKDTNNIAHSDEKEIPLTPGASSPQGGIGATGSGFQRGNRQTGFFLGLSLIQTAGLAIGLIVAGYLVYTRWYKKRQQKK